MRSSAARTTRPAAKAQPAWDIAYLFPPQGQWTEEEYLALETNRLVELSAGCLKVLPMPTTWHQFILAFLYEQLTAFVRGRGLGFVLFAGIPVRLGKGTFREPDLVFLKKAHEGRIKEQFWKRADLVMEVVSGDRKSRRHDLVTKRAEYARAGIPEYWIVDALKERIVVLRLAGRRYAVHGEYGPGTIAESHLLTGFAVAVDDVFAAQAGPRAKSKRNGSKK
jgi:Uma2 family endonuclease